MAIDTTPSQVATNALSALPFESIIGGPLQACIKAQAMAAQTSWQFIKEVGLNTDKDGTKKAVTVSFEFTQAGKEVRLNVPLLTIVPIPYIAINSVDINFKANISASASTHEEKNESQEIGAEADVTMGLKVGPFHMDAHIKANYSSKKDSKATQDSKYSVEYTLDVAVKAGQESMPAGLAKVLEILNSAISISDSRGKLGLSARALELKAGEQGKVIVTYQNPDGLNQPDAIKVDGIAPDKLESRDGNIIITVTEAKPIKVAAGQLTETINVTAAA